MKKIIYGIMLMTGLALASCEPVTIEGGTPSAPVTAETFKYTVSPIMDNGKTTNRILVETQSPVTCYWNNEVASQTGNSVWLTLFHTGENEISVHGINQDGSTFDTSFKVNVDVMKYAVDELYEILTDNSKKEWVFTKYGVTWGDPTQESDFSMYDEGDVKEWSEALEIGNEYIGASMILELKGTRMTLCGVDGKKTEGSFSFVRVAEGESIAAPTCCFAKFVTIDTHIPFANAWWGPASNFTSLQILHASADKLILTANDGNIWCWVFEPKK